MRFGLVKQSTPVGLLIRARLWEPWSHAYVVDGTGIIDSTFKHGGVRRREVVNLGQMEMECLLPREGMARAFLAEQIGRPYDWRAVFGWAGAGRDWRDDYAWFCFELVAGAIEAGSDYRFNNRNRVTGYDLQRAAMALGGQG